MAKKNTTLLKIKITNWEKYNKNRKKSYRCIMISERFLDDAKISSLTPVKRLLFLSCLLACSQSDVGEAEVSIEMISRQSGVKPKLILSCLDEFQELRILSYASNEVLYINEMNRNEMNRNEMKVISAEVTKTARASKAGTRGCISEFDFDPIVKDLFDTCTDAAQQAWLGAYPSIDWIVHEAKKANAWMISNPKKRPKDFQKFFNNWLNKGFENYRKGVPSVTKTYAEKIQERNDEVRRQLLEEQQ